MCHWHKEICLQPVSIEHKDTQICANYHIYVAQLTHMLQTRVESNIFFEWHHKCLDFVICTLHVYELEIATYIAIINLCYLIM